MSKENQSVATCINKDFENACISGNLERVKELANEGIKISTLSLQWACHHGHLEIVEYLIDECNVDIHAIHDIALCIASNEGQFEIVKFLVGRGANIHTQNDAPLCHACFCGHLNIAKYLVKHGADIHIKDDWCLKVAYDNEKIDIIEYLKSCE